MSNKFTLRTRFKKEIVSEFVMPAKPSAKVIIFCGGMPSYPSKKEAMFFLAAKGYWVFAPRYRGTWESDGSFLRKSPHVDIIDVVDGLSSGFANLWDGKIHRIHNPEVYVIGSSFGGPAALLVSSDPRIKKVVALSPVVDWNKESKIEPLSWIEEFTNKAFGNGYRFTKKDWQKLKTGKFYSPVHEIKKLDPKKILIIHAKDDEIVYVQPVVSFAESLGCKLVLLKKGGHLSLSVVSEPAFWKQIKKFLK